MNETTHSSSLPSQFDPSSLSPSEERAPLPPVHPSSTPPQSQELLSSPETPLPPTTPKTPQLPSGSRTSNNSIPKSTQINLLRTNESGMVNDSSSSRADAQEDIGLGFGAVGGNGFGGRLGGGGGGKEGAGGHQSLVNPSAVRTSSSSRAQPSTSASTSSHPQTHHRSSTKGNVVPSASGTASSSSSSSTFLPPPPPPPPSSSSSTSTTTHFKRPIASSSHSKPHPPSSTTFTIRPTPVPLASSADDVPMRSPSPSPQRPETSNSLVPSSAAGSDDEEGEDDVEDEEEEEDEPAGVPTEEEIEKLQEKVDQLSLEFGLGDDEEVGDDESREMKGLREMRDLIAPLLPALHMIPTLYSQVQSQSESIVSLRKVLTIQAELAQRAAEENRSIQEVERAGWESSLNVLLDKARDAHGKEMAIQQEKVAQSKPKAWSSGPSQSKKETGFAKIETVDNEDYDKLIKKWLELQAENRKAGVEKTTMMYKIRDSETQISALTEELHFLRASALHGSRSAPPPPLPSARNFRPPAPIYGLADDLPLPPPARRQTLGDARAEHLLLAAKRLRTLRVANPEIGLIKTADYGLAGMDVPEDVKNLGGVLAKSGGGGGGASSSMMALGSSGFESSGLDGDGDDDMGSGTVGGRTPKAKAAARGKGKKSLAGSNSLHIISSSSAALPIPRTPTAASKGKSPSKKKGGAASGATPSVEMTPGGTAIPGASFDDLLMAAGVFSRPTTTTTMGVSAARGSANADDGEDEIDEIESDGGSSTLIESPKRRRVEGGPASSWVPGQTLTSGDLSRQQQQQPIAGPSSSSSASVVPPRNPLNSSTGSEGTMHATALDLLALASFGSQDPSSSSVHNPSSQASASSSSSSRLGGVMASSQPTNTSSSQHGNGNGGGLVSLEPAFVLRSSPDLDPSFSQNNTNNAHPSSSSFYPAQHTPLRPNQYQQDDLFSPSTTPGSSVPSRVKDFAGVEGGGVGGAGGEGLFGSPAGGGKFVNMSAANVPGAGAGAAGANGGNNMPARRVRSPYLKWSNEEDELLARGVAKYGQKWDLVSKAVPTRSYHQCRQRWLRKLGVFDHKPAIATSTSNSATIFGGHADQES